MDTDYSFPSSATDAFIRCNTLMHMTRMSIQKSLSTLSLCNISYLPYFIFSLLMSYSHIRNIFITSVLNADVMTWITVLLTTVSASFRLRLVIMSGYTIAQYGSVRAPVGLASWDLLLPWPVASRAMTYFLLLCCIAVMWLANHNPLWDKMVRRFSEGSNLWFAVCFSHKYLRFHYSYGVQLLLLLLQCY